MTRLPRTLDQEQVTSLLASPDLHCPTGLRNRALMEAMYRAGLRSLEVRQLRPENIRWKRAAGGRATGGFLAIRKSKMDSSRYVPMDARLASWLDKWDRRRPAGAEWFFCTLEGGQLDAGYLRTMMRREAVKAGLNPAQVSPHVLRHTYATELVQLDNVNLRNVQELLGHARLQTTEIYTHVTPRDLERVIEGRPTREEDLAPEEELVFA